MTDYVVVTAISSHRIRYVMHKEDLRNLNVEVEPTQDELVSWAKDVVTSENCEDFSQTHLGEQISDTDILTEDEMLELFDRDNDYLKDWDRDYKIDYTRKALNLRRY